MLIYFVIIYLLVSTFVSLLHFGYARQVTKAYIHAIYIHVQFIFNLCILYRLYKLVSNKKYFLCLFSFLPARCIKKQIKFSSFNFLFMSFYFYSNFLYRVKGIHQFFKWFDPLCLSGS